MARTAVLGLPRIGPNRELKFALEASLGRAHRRSRSSRRPPRGLRRAGWERARAAGIDVIPSGDFSLYDHVLDTAGRWARPRRASASSTATTRWPTSASPAAPPSSGRSR